MSESTSEASSTKDKISITRDNIWNYFEQHNVIRAKCRKCDEFDTIFVHLTNLYNHMDQTNHKDMFKAVMRKRLTEIPDSVLGLCETCVNLRDFPQMYTDHVMSEHFTQGRKEGEIMEHFNYYFVLLGDLTIVCRICQQQVSALLCLIRLTEHINQMHKEETCNVN